MPAPLRCHRCKKEAPSIEDALPLPDDLERLVREHVCAACWREWQDMEIIVINELRLNFMDPAAQGALHQRMKEFFELSPTP